MSMFHELMMRKKEQIMYATIKGTLTENDGVFSGFSSSNYLLGQTNITSEMQQQYLQSFEFQTKIKISTITQETQILYFPYRGMLSGITLRSNGAIRWYVISSNYNIISTSLFSNGDTVYIKGKISNGIATLYSSIDGTNWITEGSVTLGTLEATDVNIPIRLGKSGTTSAVGFEGSIDLNNSYIKLGSTKYNLQAVVGYTVVGSPTIVDGVVSGFSGIDYVQIPNPKIDNTPFEFFVSFAMGNDMTGQQNLLTENNLNMRLYKLTSDSCFKFRFYDKNVSNNLVVALDYTIQADTSYKYKVRYNNSILVIAIYDNANNLLAENSISNVSPLINDQIKIGSLGTSNGYLKGSIDLNNTYIKINNKLWFNGQQA